MNPIKPISDLISGTSSEESDSFAEFDIMTDASRRTLYIICSRVVNISNGNHHEGDESDMNGDTSNNEVDDESGDTDGGEIEESRYHSRTSVMSKTALLVLAEGSEEMEAVITVDVLRRGGVSVTLAGLDGGAPIRCSRDITVVPDKSLADALAERPQYDAVILPGGLDGTERLIKSEVVGKLLKDHENSGKIIAAICAAPTAFVAHGVAQNKRVTSYPSMKDKIVGAPGGYQYIEGERVVVDGNVVTSRGPGTAFWFGLSLLELLTTKDQAQKVEKGMVLTGF